MIVATLYLKKGGAPHSDLRLIDEDVEGGDLSINPKPQPAV